MIRNVLVLGAGLVVKPLVRYLLDEPDFKVKVASRTVSKAINLIGGHPRGAAETLLIENLELLKSLIKESDIVISLVPYTYHVKVAEICIEFGKKMVTTSYISPAMKALDEKARNAGILILNEIGLDPGIDHMSAMRIIHNVEKNSGRVVSFYSYCGGLPAPEANTNPFGYKFSWSPRGVLMAGGNPGRYLKNNEEVFVPGEVLFKHYWYLEIEGSGNFEAYPNRNSLPYIETYNLKHVHSMFRGTIRNIGWCDTLYSIVQLGLFDENKRDDLEGITFEDLTRKLTDAKSGFDTREATAKFLGLDRADTVLDRLEWLELFSKNPLAGEKNNLLDTLVAQMLAKMSYEENERDMIILFHEFIAEYPEKKKKITSTLVDFGIPGGYSAMSRTVSLPAAIATKLILQGKIDLKGVHIPVIPEIYDPVLNELETMDIVCKENVYSL